MSESGISGSDRRRSRSEADRLALEFEQSGMTRSAFCIAHDLSTHRLDYYRRMRRERFDGPPSLLPVELVGAPCCGVLRVELGNGRRIVVEEGFSASLLKSVVAALEA